MRIIAGESHGRRLKAPRGRVTRPTTARVRNSIFSRLSARMDLVGARVLDLYAGSGSLGIEALSRGAAHASFVDSSPAAAAAIGRNLKDLGLESRGAILSCDVRRALKELAEGRSSFDLVFIDAPYRDDLTAQILEDVAELGLLARQGWVVAEQYKRAPAPAGRFEDRLERAGVATLGDHRIALYRRTRTQQT